jgi:riboflavin biosynthesis pyrimidine reductase
MHTVLQLYPAPRHEVALEGLYLARVRVPRVLVYTNFIVSLDGRIAVEHPGAAERSVPQSVSNAQDWRLFQELAAGADALLLSAHFFRRLARGEAQGKLPLSDDPTFADLHAWRANHGLPPQPAVVVLSANLDLLLAGSRPISDRRVYVATGERADAESVARLEDAGMTVIYAGEGSKVDGARLIGRLAQAGFRSIYSIAGPSVLETLLQAGVLDRIYLTQVHRMIGGSAYTTLLEGDLLRPPADFSLQALYHDSRGGMGCGQFFSIYETTVTKPVQDSRLVSERQVSGQ